LEKYFEERGYDAGIGNGYGQCEFGAGIASRVCGGAAGSAGTPYSHVTIGIFDPETNEEVGYNQLGEIRAMAPTMMLGYYKNPEADKNFFWYDKMGNKWGHTGDVGYLDNEGNLFVKGRATDYILDENGKTNWLFKIEDLVLEDEAVQLCEVVGLKVGTEGKKVPVVHIVLKPEYEQEQNILLTRINKYLEEKLDPSHVPVGMKLRNTFSATPGGKRDTLILEAEEAEYDEFVKPKAEGMFSVYFSGSEITYDKIKRLSLY